MFKKVLDYIKLLKNIEYAKFYKYILAKESILGFIYFGIYQLFYNMLWLSKHNKNTNDQICKTDNLEKKIDITFNSQDLFNQHSFDNFTHNIIIDNISIDDISIDDISIDDISIDDMSLDNIIIDDIIIDDIIIDDIIIDDISLDNITIDDILEIEDKNRNTIDKSIQCELNIEEMVNIGDLEIKYSISNDISSRFRWFFR